ncbi:MAG: hypothetical protein WCD42_09680 [Rhizomicrobium sp.]
MFDLQEIYEDAALAAAEAVLGDGLPFPPLPVPRYQPISQNGWRFSQHLIPAAPGYFYGPQVLSQPTAILSRGGITWMSLVPMEIESQMPHAAAASGKVVICGLGMGVMAYAVAARRAVRQVVVVERDAELAAMFQVLAGFDSWPQRDKIELVIADARDFRCDDADFLYADIWPYYRMDEMIIDMQKIHRGCPAPRCGYWGQEIDMVDWARAKGCSDFGVGEVGAYISAHHVPLIGADIPGYADLCLLAAQNPAIGAVRRPTS